jgi:hypothetical protein
MRQVILSWRSNNLETILEHIFKSTGVEEEGVANGKWKKITANQTG